MRTMFLVALAVLLCLAPASLTKAGPENDQNRTLVDEIASLRAQLLASKKALDTCMDSGRKLVDTEKQYLAIEERQTKAHLDRLKEKMGQATTETERQRVLREMDEVRQSSQERMAVFGKH